MKHDDAMIIGAGLAGLSTALHLDREALVLEAREAPGGLAVTEFEQGHGFDVTGHWLHMRDPDVRARLGGLVPMHDVVRKSSIFAYGRMVAYPFQSNLRDVPHDVRMECVLGAVEAHCRRTSGTSEPSAFGDFVRHHFGEGIAREFMFPYNTKLWGVAPNDISHAWCQRFVPIPDLKGILEGCFSDANIHSGYNASFSYPNQGGIGAFTLALAGEVKNLRCGQSVARIHAGERWLETEAGERLFFRDLVSTMPLKELVRRLVDAPPEVKAAGELLRCTQLSYFNLGLCVPALAGLHWVYLPDREAPLYRLGSFSNAVPYMAPEGGSSLYVELANDRELDLEEALDATLEVISRIGPRTVGRDQVTVWQKRTIPYAYVIYDHAYEQARKTVLDFLAQRQIQSIGRYGKWVYASMEDALMDGRNAAACIKERA